MLLSYLRIALRNIKKDRIFSVINIAGLAVGVTCFLALFLFIKDELSFDKYIKDSEQISRVYVKSQIGTTVSCNSKTPGLLGPVLKNEFPEILTFTRIGYFGARSFKCNDKTFRQYNIYWVDSSFFEFFTMPFISGNSKTALKNPGSMVITESSARKYFGSENPVGKMLQVPDRPNESYLITGVISDFPKNSHFSCEFMASITTIPVINDDNWLELWYSTYVKFSKGTDTRAFEKKLDKIVEKYVGPKAEAVLGVPIKEFFHQGNSYKYLLQPLSSIYLYSRRDYGIDLNTEWGSIRQSDISYIYIFSAVAVFILLIAVINFMNLSTARSERRAKEVGIRKTLGSNKLSLIGQFIMESVLMAAVSVMFSIALLELILPLFNKLIERQLKLELFTNVYSAPLLICFALFVGILSGSYPAFYLSSFEPVQILKAASGSKGRRSILRNVLVIFQFAVSICLLTGTLIIMQQLNFIRNKNLGLNKELLIQVENVNILGSHVEAFKNELLKHPGIRSLSNSNYMFSSGIPGHGYFFDKITGSDPISMQYLETDYSFLKTYEIRLSSGRFFSKDFPTDSSAVVINEAALKVFGDQNPIGKDLIMIGTMNAAKSYKIIGVARDFNYESLHQTVRPLAIHLLPEGGKGSSYNMILTIKISPENINGTINHIRNTWNRFHDPKDFFYDFVDKNIAQLYSVEERIGVLTSVFTFLAIFIACLGLFGLAAFVTEQRTKEIGIRKALGASVFEIIMLLSKEFTKWVVLANIIAWPAAFYIMRNWLENFAYRIEISLWTFVFSGLAALIIALTTVGVHAFKAAKADPIKSLKYE